MGLSLTRTYNHYWTGVGLFGQHWISNLDYSLASSGGGATATNLWLQRPDGRRIKFKRTASGRWEEDKAQAIASVTLSGNVYTHRSEDGMVEQYNANGYVTRVTNRQGVSWVFTYSNNYLQRVTHSSGRFIQLTWSNGQLTRVTDPAGNHFAYTYTANALGSGRHRLASATMPGSPATTVQYHYEDSRFRGGLTGKSFNGVRYSRFAYDANGRAILSEHAGGVDRYTFSYELNPGAPRPPPPPPPPPPVGGTCDPATGVCQQPRSGGIVVQPLSSSPATVVDGPAAATSAAAGTVRRVIETNPLGKRTTYEFEDGKRIATIGHASAHCPAADKVIVYDDNGYPSITEDFNGNRTATTYNAKGQLTETREAFGTAIERRTTYAWNADNRMTRRTVVGHVETTWAYDSNDRLSSVTTKNLGAHGVTNQARTTTYGYTTHANGLLASMVVDGPLPGTADAVTYSYNANGALTRVRNGLGHQTLFQNHTALGAPGKITGANGKVTDITTMHGDASRASAPTRTEARRTRPTPTTPPDCSHASRGRMVTIRSTRTRRIAG